MQCAFQAFMLFDLLKFTPRKLQENIVHATEALNKLLFVWFWKYNLLKLLQMHMDSSLCLCGIVLPVWAFCGLALSLQARCLCGLSVSSLCLWGFVLQSKGALFVTWYPETWLRRRDASDVVSAKLEGYCSCILGSEGQGIIASRFITLFCLFWRWLF
jgi:hypothetical protein